MSQDWVPGNCNEKAGFLFSHGCDQPSLHDCAQCGKPVCMSHAHHTEAGILCTTCVKTQGRPGGKPQEGFTSDSARPARSTSYPDRTRDDAPYFYAGAYYVGYGNYGHGHWGHSHYHSAQHSHQHDANDFTEADGESLAHAGDEDFETDLGAS